MNIFSLNHIFLTHSE